MNHDFYEKKLNIFLYNTYNNESTMNFINNLSHTVTYPSCLKITGTILEKYVSNDLNSMKDLKVNFQTIQKVDSTLLNWMATCNPPKDQGFMWWSPAPPELLSLQQKCSLDTDSGVSFACRMRLIQHICRTEYTQYKEETKLEQVYIEVDL
jgi:hypothetical protein